MADRGFFITGTDTDAGKTLVACTLARELRRAGERVAVAKPVAAGADWIDGQLKNDDALALQQAAGDWQSYEQINPMCFEEAIAPHIAARGATLSVDSVFQGLSSVLAESADTLLVEGAGGWHVPLNEQENLSDLAVKLALPVVLVVGVKLGCINHALLTAEAIQAAGLPLAGWVGSVVQPDMPALAENIETLNRQLSAPCWGVLPHCPAPDVGSFIGRLQAPVGH